LNNSNYLVLHFILDHRVGGPHNFVKNINLNLRGGYHSLTFTSGRGARTDVALINLRHLFSLLYIPEIVINSLLILLKVKQLKKNQNNIIFHVHGALNISPIIAAYFFNYPIIWHIHETLPKFKPLVYFGNALLRGRNLIFALVAKKSSAVYQLSDFEYIPASIDLNYWKISNASHNPPADWSQSSNVAALRIIMIANINPLKGFDLVFEALAELNFPWSLKIVGMPLSTHKKYYDLLNRRAVEIIEHGDNKIEFLGHQSSDQIRNLLEFSDLFLLASSSEACPISLLESLSMGVYSISSDVGDVKEICSGLKNAVVLKKYLPEELRGEITKANESGAYKIKIEGNVNSAWSSRSSCNSIETLYLRLING
jgi:glycosyltransferase involved in cell wall biosynthesis